MEFYNVISREGFDLTLLKLSTVVWAWVKIPIDTRLRDIIVKQKDQIPDEFGLAVAHYIALASEQPRLMFMHKFYSNKAYDTRWKSEQGQLGGNAFRFITRDLQHLSGNTPQGSFGFGPPRQPAQQFALPNTYPAQPGSAQPTPFQPNFAPSQPPLQQQHTGFGFGAPVQPSQPMISDAYTPQLSQPFVFSSPSTSTQPMSGQPNVGHQAPSQQPLQKQHTGFGFSAPVQPAQQSMIPNAYTPQPTIAPSSQVPSTSFGFGAPRATTSEQGVGHSPFAFARSVVASTAVVEELVASQKYAVNIRSEFGETPLLVLCKSSLHRTYKLENARALLTHGAGVNLADNRGWTPLHAALSLADYNLAQLLLSKEANINAQDELGITPLMAWFYGYNSKDNTADVASFYEDSIALLQHKEIDFALADKHFNRTVGHLMACVAPPSLLDVVLKNISPNLVLEARDTEGFAPLHHAVMFCNSDMIDYLIKNGASVNAQSYALKLTPLMIYFAIHNEHSPHRQWLEHCNTTMQGRLTDTSVPDTKNSYKYFALSEPSWIARFRKTSSHMPAVTPKTIKQERWQNFTYKADLSLGDRFGNNLLHLFINGKQMLTLDAVPTELNSLWNHQNTKGETPLHLLLDGRKVEGLDFERLFKFIVAHDIDVLLADINGISILELVLTNKKFTVEDKQRVVALAKKVHVKVPTVIPQPKKVVQRSILHSLLTTTRANMSLIKTITSQFEHEINAQDEDGNTPLMVLLQKYFADPNASNAKPALYYDLKREEPLAPALCLTIIEYLMTCPGVDFTVQNNAGDTALHMVCRYFHVGALEAMLNNFNSYEQASKYCVIAFRLLDGGADVTIKNNAGETVLDYAPKLMYHYQQTYPLIKDYKHEQETPATFVFGQEYDLSALDSE